MDNPPSQLTRTEVAKAAIATFGPDIRNALLGHIDEFINCPNEKNGADVSWLAEALIRSKGCSPFSGQAYMRYGELLERYRTTGSLARK